MPRKFDCFVIFAEMRTGSNFLESNLDLFPGLETFGEAFNPYFMVRPNLKELFGVTTEARNANPLALIEKMKENARGIPGFRFFHDHDARVFEHIIDDPRCAKVVLTRNLVESYVSRRIAKATNQWLLRDVQDAKKKKAYFDAEEFESTFHDLKDFQLKLLGRLQRSGQTAFFIDYEDLRDLEVINGLGKFLGEEVALEALADKYKKQNPEALTDKVTNYDEMIEAVAKIDIFDLGRIPNFEPRRTPLVPSYVTGAKAPLMFMPVPGAPGDEIREWLAALDGVGVEELGHGMSQKNMRQWKRRHPGHRSFTVIRHPAERAHAAFCRHFLSDGPAAYPEIGRTLSEHFDVPLPEHPVPGEGYDRDAHRAAFVAFLGFVKANLAGQTPVRVDGSWASQGQVIQGFGQVLPPDHILRESQLAQGLVHLCEEVGLEAPKAPERRADTPFTLVDIYDDAVEQAVRDAYQRDYMLFGFKRWDKEAGGAG